MKKLFFIVLTLLFTGPIFSQWVTKVVDNQLDEPYRIAYCLTKSQRAILKMESAPGIIALYITGSYFCDESPVVDLAFVVNGVSKKYSLLGFKSNDSRTIFLYDNLLDPENVEILQNFKKCSSIIIRINESHCTSEFHTFNMAGSSSAVEFMSK
jgi:hypothetical protein